MMMKRILIIGLAVGLFVVASGCDKIDVAGKWEMTLTWDERSVFEGEPPPPTVLQLELKNGKVFNGKEDVGNYLHKRGKRVRIRPGRMKIICYGDIIDVNHMEGDISYFPSSEIYGTWTAKRLDISGPKR
jgi:hypothetical protein